MKYESILVLGGSGGIGCAICTRLHQEGKLIFVGYSRNATQATELAQVDPERVIPLELDVTCEEFTGAGTLM